MGLESVSSVSGNSSQTSSSDSDASSEGATGSSSSSTSSISPTSESGVGTSAHYTEQGTDGFHQASDPQLSPAVQRSTLLARADSPATPTPAPGPAPTPANSKPAPSSRPTSVTTPLTTSGSGTTEAPYKIGAPQRPDIKHDNGFLQNPKDASDKTLQPTRAPTNDERIAYVKQVAKAEAATAAVDAGVPKWMVPSSVEHYLDLPDGIKAYEHFLTGDGADRQFSYDKFVKDDASGKAILNNAIGDTQRGAENLYQQMVAKDPSLANKTVTFEVTGGKIGVGNGGSYPYPKTENWQKAIGAHTIWNSATVTVKPPTEAGGKPSFSISYTLHAEDRYNFNPGQKDIATGQPDSDNGRFEVTGLAKQYMNYGTSQRDVSWNSGDINGSTSVKTGGR
jgi:hypothetical protein